MSQVLQQSADIHLYWVTAASLRGAADVQGERAAWVFWVASAGNLRAFPPPTLKTELCASVVLVTHRNGAVDRGFFGDEITPDTPHLVS